MDFFLRMAFGGLSLVLIVACDKSQTEFEVGDRVKLVSTGEEVYLLDGFCYLKEGVKRCDYTVQVPFSDGQYMNSRVSDVDLTSL